jgi:hypothetical protein
MRGSILRIVSKSSIEGSQGIVDPIILQGLFGVLEMVRLG